MAYLPCLNPSCNSHGQPHPHCKCYSNMATGGIADHFCASNNPHSESCEYYAPGGQVGQLLQPRAFQSPLMGDPEDHTAAAMAHGGANMLFGSPKSPYFGAFGSGSTANKLAGNETAGNMMGYMSRLKKGHKAVDQGVESLFTDGSPEFEDKPEKEREQIKEYINKGGIDAEMQAQHQQQLQPQGYAEGGSVSMEPKREDPLSGVYPEHNLILNTAKARVSHYLNSMKPQEEQPTLPFDPKKDMKVQNKNYDKAVQMAAQPLGILKEVKDGSLTPDVMKHFTQMWPEVHTHLSKKMTEQIMKAQMKGERPPYKVRQAMSMFMGSTLDSTMTPASIMAAQNVFASKAAQQQPQQAPTKNKKGTSTLSKASEPYQTASQAAQARQKQ